MNLSELADKYMDGKISSQETFEKYITDMNNKINMVVLQNLNIDREIIKELLKKLHNYKFIEEIDDLKCGTCIKWIALDNINNINLNTFGIICEIKFTNEGTNIVCKNFSHRHYTLKMEDCLIFQKFTKDDLDVIKMVDMVL
jgi:hypothetical protein